MKAKQCEFYDENTRTHHFGIIVGDKVICGCCGEILEKEKIKIIEYYDEWYTLENF